MQCNVHNEPMTEKDGQWGKYWSHRTEDKNYPKGWCNGKPPKESPNAIQSQALDVILNKIIKIESRLDKMALFLSGQVETKPATKDEKKDVPF